MVGCMVHNIVCCVCNNTTLLIRPMDYDELQERRRGEDSSALFAAGGDRLEGSVYFAMALLARSSADDSVATATVKHHG